MPALVAGEFGGRATARGDDPRQLAFGTAMAPKGASADRDSANQGNADQHTIVPSGSSSPHAFIAGTYQLGV